MEKEEETILFAAPPRLLLGVAFLFWGAMHDRPLAALLAAILMEGRHWTGLRWHFGERGFARSWQVSVVILIISAFALFQIEEREASDFLGLLSWLPFIMMPLALAQQYASDPGVPVTTFSFIARRKMVADRKAGRAVELKFIQLGCPYFFLILIVSGMGVGVIVKPGPDEIRYAVGVALLLGWAMFAMPRRAGRKGAWGWAFLCSVVMAMGMSWAVIAAYQYFVKSLARPLERSGSAFESQTAMGQVHELQLSPKIHWRYYHEEGPVPALVRISSYNEIKVDLWSANMRRRDHRESIPRERRIGGDFQSFLRAGEEAFIFDEEDREVKDFLTRGTIVGMVSDQTLIPHPANTKRYEQVPTEILSANSMGAVQLNAPRQGAMRIKLFSDPGLKQIEHDPSQKDVEVPHKEVPGLNRHLLGLGLVPSPPGKKEEFPKPRDVSREEFEEIRGRMARSFLEDFQYTLFISGSGHQKRQQRLVTEFLEKTREGHCEYFASATALLLRQMEVPARYVVGFSVQEEGEEGEYLLRGKHAHAWVQAYVGGTWVDESEPGKDPVWRCRGGEWVDVDLTPPDWLAGNEELGWMQGFWDWWQKARANLVIWMANPGVSKGFKIFLAILGGGFLLYLIWTLMRTRRHEGRVRPGSWDEKVRRQGLLRDFERWLARQVGPRPGAMPMAAWLRNHLPQGGAGLVESYERATFHPDGIATEKLDGLIKKAKVSWKEAQKSPAKQVRGAS